MKILLAESSKMCKRKKNCLKKTVLLKNFKKIFFRICTIYCLIFLKKGYLIYVNKNKKLHIN